MKDGFGRDINYLRLAVTDRCNLRCSYCMPVQGLEWLPRKELLTYEELFALVYNAVEMGVDKLRITGGEPFVRKDLMLFLRKVADLENLKSWHITSNGVLIGPYLKELKELGLGSVNISLDSLDKEKFNAITRRNDFDKVLNSLDLLNELDIKTKINCVMMAGVNDNELKNFIEFCSERGFELRFIEEMPFNGGSIRKNDKTLSSGEIEQMIYKAYPEAEQLSRENGETAIPFEINGITVGVIPAYTRSICGDCNRIRITAKGGLKNCLYDGGVYDFKTILRDPILDDQEKNAEIQHAISRLVMQKPKDGFEAEVQSKKSQTFFESMANIGG